MFGRLRDSLQIIRASRTPDGGGGSSPETWPVITDGTIWGKVVPIAGREQYAGLALADTVSHEIKIRYHGGILVSDRIQFGTRVFTIQKILDWEERHIEMSLFVTERVAA